MECTAICRICGITLNCKDGTVFTLGEHLVKKHPDIDMNHYVMENCGDGFRQTKAKRTLSEKLSLLLKKSSTMQRGKRTSTNRSLYKTTVESWRPGVSPLKCPKCGNCEQPLIRKQRNKVANNPLGAFFLLGCWPLCFLPMLMSKSNNTIVCCRRCGHCFGTYDKKNGKLIPAEKDIKIETPDIC